MQMFTETKGYATPENAVRACWQSGIDLDSINWFVGTCGPKGDRFIVVVGQSNMHLVHTGKVAVFAA